MAKKFTAIANINVRAAADTTAEATRLRNQRIADMNHAVQQGLDPTVIDGVLFEGYDPGGGPCRPAFRKIKMPSDQSGLPEAVSHDDDD